MEIILLDFTKYLNDSKNIYYSEAFGTTLEDQFDKLRFQYFKEYKYLDIETFIEKALTNPEVSLFIPRINTEFKEVNNSNYSLKILANVSLNIKSSFIAECFTENNDFNIVCDLVEKKYGYTLEAKGFSVVNANEYQIDKIQLRDVKIEYTFDTTGAHNSPKFDFGKIKSMDNYFNDDLLDYIIEDVHFLENQEDTFDTYNTWIKYLNFRKYYLAIKTQESYDIESVNLVHGYYISKRDYKLNKKEYEAYLYNGDIQLEEGFNILLNTSVAKSEEVELVEVLLTMPLIPPIDDSQEEFSKQQAEIEKTLRKYSRLDLKLQNKKKEESFIPLGERFNIVFYDLVINKDGAYMPIKIYFYQSNFAKSYRMVESGNIDWSLKINSIAELRKIERQEEALKSFFNGYVKNHNLISYFFNPDNINPTTAAKQIEASFFLPTLNDSQKKAVNKALNSSGIFLLQGPPGTGKTQVIAELTTQLVQQGKKVFISSETHKAIDNVFDRLPKVSFIHPLKLMGYSNKKNEHGINKLVDNFYYGIANNLKSELNQYEYAQEIYAEVIKLSNDIKKLNNRINEVDEFKHAFRDYLLDIKICEKIIAESNKRLECFLERRNEYKILMNSVRIGDFNADIIKEFPEYDTSFQIFLRKMDNYIRQSSRTQPLLKNLDSSSLSEILDMVDIYEDVVEFDVIKKIHVRYYNNWVDSEIAPAVKEINESISCLKEDIQIKANDIKNQMNILFPQYKKRNLEEDTKLKQIEDNIDKKKKQIQSIVSREILSKGYCSQEALEKVLVNICNQSYIKELMDAYLQQIEDQYDDQDTEIFNDIIEYITDKKTIENDKKPLTEEIVKTINVFGATCSSSNFFSSKKISGDEDIIVDDINLKKVDIDVVIIDEISKLSLLDILVPISYGKSLILVGDHRQLPPMYDLKHMRKDEFNELDPEVITYQDNLLYTKLIEDCYFKIMYEKMPSSCKIMLDTQYRCHSDIMNVFNYFYSDGTGQALKIGLPNQDEIKKHELNIVYKDTFLITEDKHVYFIDSNGYESRNADSTSIINETEADCVVKMLELMNEEYGNMLKSGLLKKKYSVGVVCTYKDQANLIRNKLKARKNKLQNFSQEQGERLIISTVDDFQGDERDIIIVSMVRNPDFTKNKNNTSFIDKFERINVAFSRARALLCIVGSAEFLSHSKIDIPDINGNKSKDRKNIAIYKQIIDFITKKGICINQVDLLGENWYE